LNRAEYQRLRRQIDEELRAGIDMLQAGYRAKVEALDALWVEPPSEKVPATEPELSAPPAPEPPAPSSPEPSVPPIPEPAAPPAESKSARRRDGEIQADLEAALEQVADVFLASDLCRALGYEPPRTSLYRALATLQREGILKIESPGEGRRANLYRRVRNEAEG
jgi:hypothetical protein